MSTVLVERPTSCPPHDFDLLRQCRRCGLGTVRPADDVPPTISTAVPVTCDACGEDMTFTVEWQNRDHRCWTFHCTHCGLVEEEAQPQKRHHLLVNANTEYIGSYWGPDG